MYIYSEIFVEERLDFIVSIKIYCIFVIFRIYIWLVLIY